MSWRDFISDLYITRNDASGLIAKPAFQPPASTQRIADMESQVGNRGSGLIWSLLA